jgi:predicted nucleic-acid-binding Zn-ribbon protein
MTRTDNFKALSNVTGDAKSGTVDASAGLVVMPFLCDECGYLELYVADRERFLKED